jgi:hypothetical protein
MHRTSAQQKNREVNKKGAVCHKEQAAFQLSGIFRFDNIADDVKAVEEKLLSVRSWLI